MIPRPFHHPPPAPPVLGVTAPPARPTFRGALWLACILSLPVFCLLTAAEWAFRLAF